MDSSLKVSQFLTPYMRSFCYLVADGNRAIIIDPCELKEIDRWILAGKSIDFCLLTHEHFDHISGLDWVHSLGIPVISSKKCGQCVGDSKKNQSRYYEAFCMLQKRIENDPIPKVEEYYGYVDLIFEQEARFQWNDHNIFLKETPGHSEGSICILLDDQVLFSGDTLFLNDETNCNMKGGDRYALKNNTMPWIESLNRSITVYPGHYENFKLWQRIM